MKNTLAETKPYQLNTDGNNYARNGGVADSAFACRELESYFVVEQREGKRHLYATFWFYDGSFCAEFYEVTTGLKARPSAAIRNPRARKLERQAYARLEAADCKELSWLIMEAEAKLRENYFNQYRLKLGASLEGLLASSVLPHHLIGVNTQN